MISNTTFETSKDSDLPLNSVNRKSEKNFNDPSMWYYIDKGMIPAKLTYFFTGLERSSIAPYLAMFLVSIGLNLKQVGYVFSFSYAGLMLGSVFWGVIADKTRAYRVLLSILYFFFVLITLSIPLVSAKIGEKEKNQCPLLLSKCCFNSTMNFSTSKTSKDNVSVSSSTMTIVMATLGFLVFSFGGSIYSYNDAGVIWKIKMSTKKRDYGRQYMFLNIGFSFGALISGQVMNIFPKVDLSCYFAVFCVNIVFIIASCICSQYLYKNTNISSQKEIRSNSFQKDLFKTLSNFEVDLFLLTTFVNGLLYSIYLSYFFLFMKEIKSTDLLVGLTVAFGSTSGMIINFFNEVIIKLFRGTFNTMIMCTFLWSVRYFIFYFLKNPWLIIPLQLTLHGLNLSLFLSVKSIHLKKKAPISIHNTMFGIVQSLYSGVSMIVGSFVGGQLYFGYGARITFLYSCFFALGWTSFLTVYIIAIKIWKINVGKKPNSVCQVNTSINISNENTKF
ncbi:major facilitator superfamily domain-containing protein 6 [Hydra vulgaris]|uniref:Major facilitator superfamily domain-containing protein 6 n=1 Tax=Hydra vulgaris TaxID=6087 RepID=A0ABM4C1B5_HYDVU